MSDFIKKLLAENGELSCMRFMSCVALGAALLVAMEGLIRGRELTGVSLLVGTFLTPAFGGKIVQKALENKDLKKDQ